MSGSSPEGDVLMYFVKASDGQMVPAESTSTLAGADARLMTGFKPGYYFQADNFTFAVKLREGEGLTAAAPGARPFQRWRSLKDANAKPVPPFRGDPDDVSITRKIDSASPVLVQMCLDTQSFSSAVMVKRSRIGTSGILSPILRMEFTTVWLRSVEWEDNDAVTESLKFKFSAVSTTYVSRKPDGRVDALWPCKWTSSVTG